MIAPVQSCFKAVRGIKVPPRGQIKIELLIAMVSSELTATKSFAYRKVRPFSPAEFKFKNGLADHANRALLTKLQRRTEDHFGSNQYTGINVRLADGSIYLEAIMTNDVEWGGFGFDFARLVPIKGDLYNLSIRRLEDWVKAEQATVASASSYFMATAMSPRATDWIQIARRKSFRDCIEILADDPSF